MISVFGLRFMTRLRLGDGCSTHGLSGSNPADEIVVQSSGRSGAAARSNGKAWERCQTSSSSPLRFAFDERMAADSWVVPRQYRQVVLHLRPHPASEPGKAARQTRTPMTATRRMLSAVVAQVSQQARICRPHRIKP